LSILDLHYNIVVHSGCSSIPGRW